MLEVSPLKSKDSNYAKAASEATTKGHAVGQWEFWDRFNRNQPIKRRIIFIIMLLRGLSLVFPTCILVINYIRVLGLLLSFSTLLKKGMYVTLYPAYVI